MTVSFFFFFNDTATTEIYTLSLHDALPICPGPERSSDRAGHRRRPAGPGAGRGRPHAARVHGAQGDRWRDWRRAGTADRKSTRLNSSHANISYAVFCLKKKKSTNSNSRYTF